MNPGEILEFGWPLGVVPVFVNAGAALLPAILAALASIVSLLLRPRALGRAVRARPGNAAATACGIAGLCLGSGWLLSGPGAETRRPKSRSTSETTMASLPGIARIDWAAQAIEWIQADRLAALTAAATGVPPSNSAPAPTAAAILGGGPLRNGYLGGGAPIGLTAAWEFPQPGSPAAEELGTALCCCSPTVVGGAVYGGACWYDVLGNYGTLFCLDAATGKPRWTTSAYRSADGEERQFKGFFSSPAVSADGKYLVIGQGLHFDENCDLICVSTKTGHWHWSVSTPLHIEGSPAIEGDLAVAGAGAIEIGEDREVKGHPGLVVAVQVSTGVKRWEYQLPDPESSPVIDRGIVYIGSGFHGNAVCALRTETDEELARQGHERLLWRTATAQPATGAVTVTEDLVLVGTGNGDYVFTAPEPAGTVLALDRVTGEVRWQVGLPDGVLGRIAVVGERAVIPVRNGEVVALDLASSSTDRVLWRQRVSGERAILAGAAFTGSHVYAVSQDGCLGVLDARDGRLLERHPLNAPGRPGEQGLSVSSPTVAAGRLYVGSETGGLRCFLGREVQ